MSCSSQHNININSKPDFLKSTHQSKKYVTSHIVQWCMLFYRTILEVRSVITFLPSDSGGEQPYLSILFLYLVWLFRTHQRHKWYVAFTLLFMTLICIRTYHYELEHNSMHVYVCIPMCNYLQHDTDSTLKSFEIGLSQRHYGLYFLLPITKYGQTQEGCQALLLEFILFKPIHCMMSGDMVKRIKNIICEQHLSIQSRYLNDCQDLRWFCSVFSLACNSYCTLKIIHLVGSNR